MSNVKAPLPHTFDTEYSFLAHPFAANPKQLNYFIRHDEFNGIITEVRDVQDRKDSSFIFVPPLTNPGNKDMSVVSIVSVEYPDYYLMVRDYNDNTIGLVHKDDSHFNKDAACFRVVYGLADTNWYSFESNTRGNFFIRHRNKTLYLEQNDGSSTFHNDATFNVCIGNNVEM